jgi:hypothetical protein
VNNIEPIGVIGGNKIYADTGKDYIKMMQDIISKKVKAKQLTIGNTYMMRIELDGKSVLIEMHVKKDPIYPLN